ncbi:hypothetical protein [Hydrocarboniphaga sp.]|uniref:hypothetical protein n=1 Tax=Hydrocarboniphaga sp. TaxID=2033016 RepID=UPI003D09F53C
MARCWIFRKSLYSEGDKLIGTVDSVYFLRGDGGCGSWGETGLAFATVPGHEADGSIDILLADSAALLYRLNGDYTPPCRPTRPSRAKQASIAPFCMVYSRTV